ncbi:oxidoreductase [Ktedonosporobacter rubrisoli]|uniref:Oxidoreductase n=1 Tax=Ktedonosporobacter rubrisoli TaxID=2509675 RepID=A0A4P6JQQ4_KTERU|nr:aldo/keto reductase [Ktedonosporobacter rubrisoli]QBD77510.1 oxidoreductase [Ktedonosporobacter rubrisoli]
MVDKLAWGILGTGSIARVFAQGLAGSKTGKLVAVGSRSQAAAERFASQWNVAHLHSSYEALLSDSEVDAVYIALPHTLHAEWAIKAAEAGKHILCEKPIGINHAQAMAVIEAAQRHNVFLMEAYMYRCHPQTRRLVELIRSGAIGQVRVIQATFSFQTGNDLEHRLLNNRLGGGGILDVGGYCTSMASLIAGVATGQGVVAPSAFEAVGHVGEASRIDEYAIASLAFPGDIVAQLFTGVQVNGENVVSIFGSEGSMLVPNPWTPNRQSGKSAIILRRNGETEAQEIVIDSDLGLYSYEADTVAAHIEERQAPEMSWQDTLNNMRMLDQWRAALGAVYDLEEPDGPDQELPLHKRPLKVRPGSIMKYGRLPGIDKPISRLVMGVDNQRTWSHAAVMFDDFFERGGNCFDSAYIYGGNGHCEKLLGQWVSKRGVREQVVILDKGAHTPHCNPEALTQQHRESLERLQTDYVDLYMLHRDNPEIPAGEFIDVLNQHYRAGSMRAFGASNWSIARVIEANRWASERGLKGFVAMSNNFSLARMIEPVWAGCIAASDPESRKWLTETGMSLFPWSSQARGFFVGQARSSDVTDAELVRCWHSEDNFRRLERARELVRKYNVLPVTIALAYVLCQPFPTFPLIGPRTLTETGTSFPALTLELSPEEVRWLNLED